MAPVKVRLGLGKRESPPATHRATGGPPSHSPNVDPMASYFPDNVVSNGSVCLLHERLVGFFARLPESVS
jgi:hypothetical protein